MHKARSKRSTNRNPHLRDINRSLFIFDMGHLSLLKDIKDLNRIGKLDLVVVYTTARCSRDQQTGPDCACALFLNEM